MNWIPIAFCVRTSKQLLPMQPFDNSKFGHVAISQLGHYAMSCNQARGDFSKFGHLEISRLCTEHISNIRALGNFCKIRALCNLSQILAISNFKFEHSAIEPYFELYCALNGSNCLAISSGQERQQCDHAEAATFSHSSFDPCCM